MKNWINSLSPTKASFILPTCNRFAYLQSCIDNIANFVKVLNYDYELIVVNDGSTDHPQHEYEKIVNEFSELNGIESKYIHIEENTGTVSIPRNIGISHATGRIIVPTDDDCFPTLAKAHMIKNFIFRNPNSYLSFGNREEWAVNIDGDHNYIKTVDSSSYANNKTAVGIDNGQFIYDAAIYELIPPVFAINACDWELYKNIAAHSDFTYWPHTVCQYIWHANNISKTPKSKRVNPLDVLHKYIGYFKNNEFSDFCKSIANT